MQRIDNPPTNLYEDGNPYTQKKGTIATAAWLNAIQEELAKIVEGTGLTLDENDNEQAWQALMRRFDWWRLETATVTFVDASSFKVSGNVTAIYAQHRAVKLTQTSDDKGYVVSAVYSSPDTTVTVTGCTVDSGLTAVEYGQEVENKPYNPNTVPSGAEVLWSDDTPPPGWFEEDGALYVMTTYEALFDILGVKYGKNTGTVFTADYTTNTLTSAGHGRSDNDIITLSNSGGALPAGLAADTKYFIVNAATDTFQVSTTQGGSPVNFTDNGTGTHSFHIQFKVPDMRGEFPRGWDHTAGNDPDSASRTDRGDGTTGDNIGTKQMDEFKSHTHNFNKYVVEGSGAFGSGATYQGPSASTATGGNETRGRNVNKMFIIKY
ncbi:MAG: phage tail protein [Thermodesulfobacteriota bacterium]|nr:phage tail protein [Thermodesulfobacteriota bacterium]